MIYKSIFKNYPAGMEDVDKFLCRHKRCDAGFFRSAKSRYRHEHTVIHLCLESSLGLGCKCCMKKLLKTHVCEMCKEYKTTRKDNLVQHYRYCSRRCSDDNIKRLSKFEEVICEEILKVKNERNDIPIPVISLLSLNTSVVPPRKF